MNTEHIRIPNRQAAFIRDLIASGRYSSVDEVVRASVLLLEERVAYEEQQKEKLRAMLNEALAGGTVDDSFDDIWDAAETRYLHGNA